MVQKDNLNKIIIVCGATATGKSDLAVKLAKKLNSEVISADSMNIYKGLNVGTAKPTEEEKDGVVHHLIDVCSPFDNFSVSDYKRLAEPIISDLQSRNKIPIICGGTGFYINSLLYDLSYGNGGENIEIRNKYKEIAKEKGNLFVYEELKKVDPDSAKSIHYNDSKRVIRALEIYYNGKKKSDLKDEYIPKYDYTAVSIEMEREILHKRINIRVDKMIKNGLTEEVFSLLKSGLNFNYQSMQGIGYKEYDGYFEGKKTLVEVIDEIKLNTRHYAKRQITFFKKLPSLKHVNYGDNDKIAERIISEL